MKKSRKKLTFAAMLAGTALTASLLNGCVADKTSESPLEDGTYDSSNEESTSVNDPTEASEPTGDEPSYVIEKPGEYQTSEGIPAEVYGPPSAFEDLK